MQQYNDPFPWLTEVQEAMAARERHSFRSSYRDFNNYTDDDPYRNYDDYGDTNHWGNDWGGSDGYDSEDDEHRDIQFYRPDGEYEGKTPYWCRTNGFSEVEPGIWSGKWYWEHFPNRKEELEKERVKEREEHRERLRKRAYAGTDYSALEELKRMNKEDNAERQRLEEAEYEHACPINGCRRRFETIEDRDRHVKSYKSKGHKRYRQKHDICQIIEAPSTMPVSQETAALEQLSAEYEKRERDELMRRWNATKHKCPIPGCNSKGFPSIEKRDNHVKASFGKAHARYRERNDIPHPIKPPEEPRSVRIMRVMKMFGISPDEEATQPEKKRIRRDPSPSPPLPKGQTDIRSFFAAAPTGR
mmetsp:Transcript_30202/g.72493  ORF Transcript_30202/g.72493 Transcript_30202/m.72493 type:complete len:359 (+) Transcript_30202:56-1132(+)